MLLSALLCAASLLACDRGGNDAGQGQNGDQPAIPADVPIYPDGRVVERAHDGASAFQIRLKTLASVADLLAFYEKRLKSHGWREVSRIDGDNFFVAFKKGRRFLELSYLPSDAGGDGTHIINYGTR
jgi:hypothetical protein